MRVINLSGWVFQDRAGLRRLGELRYASGTARPGDYGYEAIGAHREKTHAVEETVIVYVGHGPLAMLGEEGKIRGATGSDGVNAFAMAHG
jgi:hypothetical protein